MAIHNDQYLPVDFDIVVSSIGNAFYRTDSKTEEEFLQKLNPGKENLKDFAFRKMYVAKTEDLAVGHTSRVVCTRRNCKNKTSCDFIPNYPIILFNSKTNKPANGWVSVKESLDLFKHFVG